MDDRPSIRAGLLRVLLGLCFAAIGVEMFLRDETAVHDFTRWGLPSPDLLAEVLGVANVACGVVLVLGLLPRLASLLLLAETGVALATAGRTEGGVWWAAPGVLAFLLLIVLASGGGRWALIDRIDPAPPRRLVREP